MEEKHYRNLRSYESDADFEAIWESIEAQRYPQQRKRRFAWWWFGGFAFVILLIAVSVVSYHQKLPTIASGVSSQESIVVPIDAQEVEYSDDQVGGSDRRVADEPTDSENASRRAVTVVRNTTVKQKAIDVGSDRDPVDRMPDEALFTSTSMQAEAVYKDVEESVQTDVVGAANTTGVVVGTSISSNDTDLFAAAETTRFQRSSVSVVSLTDDYSQKLIFDRAPITISSFHTPIIPLRPRVNSIGLVYGYGQDLTNFSAVDAGSDTWYNRRIDSEQHLDVQHLGLLYSRSMSSKITLSIGATAYLRTARTRLVVTEDIPTIQLDAIVGIRDVGDGTTEEVLGIAQAQETLTITDKLYNRQLDIDLSARLGYNLSTHWVVYGGLSATTYNTVSGSIISSDDEVSSFVPLESLTAKDIRVAPLGGILYQSPLASYWSIQVGLHSRWQLSNIYSTAFSQRPIDLTASIGLAYAW